MRDETKYMTHKNDVVVYRSDVMALEEKSSQELDGEYILRRKQEGLEMRTRIENSFIPESRRTKLVETLSKSILTLSNLYEKKVQEKKYGPGGVDIDD